MRFQESLQVRLRERYRRLYKSDHSSYTHHARSLRDFIQKNPQLNSIVQAANRAADAIDPQRWRDEHMTRGLYNWPQSSEGLVRVAWHILNQVADADRGQSAIFELTPARNLNDGARDLSENIIEPLLDYLEDHLIAENDVLYLLERYRRRVLWFEQARLHSAYLSDTKHGESIYEQDLRRFLFDQGVEHPFSQPEGPSGKVDVLSGVETDSPLVCEVKLFDASKYGVSYLAKGFAQALGYAADYGKTEAHLVIFNLSERDLTFDSDADAGEWPPRLQVAGVTVFLVVVPAAPRPPGSQRSKTNPVRVGRADLVTDGEPE